MKIQQILLLAVCGGMFVLVALIIYIGNNYSLNRIKSKPVGNGQHGTARFAFPREISKTYKQISYTPELWRQAMNLPKEQGLIVGCTESGQGMTALLDDSDVHTLMIGASGVGKTANFLYPNLEYCCASGMSFVTTDSKGDIYRNTASIAEKYYGYNISVIDLRNPTRSSGYNMLYLVNKYMDLYLEDKKICYTKLRQRSSQRLQQRPLLAREWIQVQWDRIHSFMNRQRGLSLL